MADETQGQLNAGTAAAAKSGAITSQGVIDLMNSAMKAGNNVSDKFPALKLPNHDYADRYFTLLEQGFGVTQEEQKDNQAAFDEASKKQQAAEVVIGAANKEKVDADAARAAQMSAVADRFVDLFGVRGNADRIAEKAVQAQQLNDDADKSLAAIQEKQSVNIFDHPLDWIVNQIDLPSMTREYNVIAKRVNGLESEINQNIAAASAATSIVQQTIPTITAQQAQASGKLAEATAVKNSEELAKQRAETDALFSAKRFASIAAIENSASQKSARDIEIAKVEWNAKVAAIQNASTAAERKLRVAALAESLLDKIQLQSMLDSYDAITGRPNGTTSIAAFNRMRSDMRENIIGIGSGSGGFDPGSAYGNLEDAQLGPKFPEQNRNYVRYLAGLKNKIQTQDQKYLTFPKAEEKAAYVRSKINEEVTRMQNDPDYQIRSNPFHEISPKYMFAKNPALAESVVGDIMKPFTSTDTPPDTDTVIATFRKAIPDPKLAAQAIAQWYTINVMARDDIMNFSILGIKSNGTYNHTWSSRGNVFNDHLTFDLTKPAMVENMLQRMNADDQVLEMDLNKMRSGTGVVAP